MDIVEAKRNIEKYETEITKWQALSRGLMSRDEIMLVDKKIAQLKERSKNLSRLTVWITASNAWQLSDCC